MGLYCVYTALSAIICTTDQGVLTGQEGLSAIFSYSIPSTVPRTGKLNDYLSHVEMTHNDKSVFGAELRLLVRVSSLHRSYLAVTPSLLVSHRVRRK